MLFWNNACIYWNFHNAHQPVFLHNANKVYRHAYRIIETNWNEMKSLIREEKKMWNSTIKHSYQSLSMCQWHIAITVHSHTNSAHKVFNKIRVNVLKRSWMENFNEKEQHSNSLDQQPFDVQYILWLFFVLCVFFFSMKNVYTFCIRFIVSLSLFLSFFFSLSRIQDSADFLSVLWRLFFPEEFLHFSQPRRWRR